MKKSVSKLLLACLIFSSASLFAKEFNGITCFLVGSYEIPMGYGMTLRTNLWDCSNMCSYTTTSLVSGGEATVLSDIESCAELPEL